MSAAPLDLSAMKLEMAIVGWTAREVLLVQEVERLRGDLDEEGALRGRMDDLLSRTAIALHGGPLENGLWSWHDLPELAAGLKAKTDREPRRALGWGSPIRRARS